MREEYLVKITSNGDFPPTNFPVLVGALPRANLKLSRGRSSEQSEN